MNNTKNNVSPFRKPTKCPNCETFSVRAYYPFCCQRCADVDLGRWLNESYSIKDNENSPDIPENNEH